MLRLNTSVITDPFDHISRINLPPIQTLSFSSFSSGLISLERSCWQVFTANLLSFRLHWASYHCHLFSCCKCSSLICSPFVFIGHPVTAIYFPAASVHANLLSFRFHWASYHCNLFSCCKCSPLTCSPFVVNGHHVTAIYFPAASVHANLLSFRLHWASCQCNLFSCCKCSPLTCSPFVFIAHPVTAIYFPAVSVHR